TSKSNRVVKNLLDIYASSPHAAQAVFVQMGNSDSTTRTKTVNGTKIRTKVKNFNLVKEIKEKLIAGGIPEHEIAIVKGDTKAEERKKIADAMNDGGIRVVIGNTQTLGVGVNMQRNLRAMHHLDAPWEPGSLEQRNGRGHRQGNTWNTVFEYRYITERLDG
ncbi:helicase-related protein, partial [Photobacterium damselae]